MSPVPPVFKLFNSISSISLFIWEKQVWVEISFQIGVPDLVQHIMEDRLRHDRGPVLTPSLINGYHYLSKLIWRYFNNFNARQIREFRPFNCCYTLSLSWTFSMYRASNSFSTSLKIEWSLVLVLWGRTMMSLSMSLELRRCLRWPALAIIIF